MPPKKKRRIMRKLQIDEISSVDDPAQAGARVVFMKRADPEQQELDLGDDKTQSAVQHMVDFLNGDTKTIEKSAMSTALLALAKGVEKVADKPEAEIKTEELQTQLDRVTAIVGLDGDERSHFDALEGTEPENAFLAKSSDERKSEMDVAKQAVEDDDPVVLTTSDGIEIRKSAGEALVAMAKSNEAIAKENKELRACREQEVLEKRATDDLAHMPGTVQVRAAMLKAVDGIGDKDQREAAMSSLKSQNDSMAAAFTERGTSIVPVEPGSFAEEFDNAVSDYAKEHKVGVPEATAAFVETPKGRELYAKQLN